MKISPLNGVNRYTPESRRKISYEMTGRTRSKETREKISAARKGMKFSKETRARMSMAQVRRHMLESLGR